MFELENEIISLRGRYDELMQEFLEVDGEARQVQEEADELFAEAESLEREAEEIQEQIKQLEEQLGTEKSGEETEFVRPEWLEQEESLFDFVD